MLTKNIMASIYFVTLTVILCVANNTASAQIRDVKTGTTIAMDSLKEGMKVTVTGKAENAKWGGTIVPQKDEVFYIDKLDEWDATYWNKKMEVTGVVRIIKHTKGEARTPDGLPRQATGERQQFILHKATIKQVP